MSVVNLEIDTFGTDVPLSESLLRGDTSKHLCHQIGKRINQLRHLRLRVGHLCESLLAQGPTLGSCSQTLSSCYGENETICTLLRSWDVRYLTLWLPWGQTEAASSFARTSRLLCERSSLHRPNVKVIYQSNEQQPTQTINQGLKSVFLSFRLTYLSNYAESTIRGCSSHNDRSGRFTRLMPCSEHQLLTESPWRYFQIPDRLHGQTSQASYPFAVEWIVEGEWRWAQYHHGSRRYPIAEGRNKEIPFWRDTSTRLRLFACLFPKCRVRERLLRSLRRHLVRAHGQWPQDETSHGARPCPSVGCSRVDLYGFYTEKDLEEHLLEHHLRPCTMQTQQNIGNN